MNKPNFWRLFSAYAVDLLVFCILFVLLGLLVWSPLFSLSKNWLWQYTIIVGSFLLNGAVYFAASEGIGNQSIGKFLFHLKVKSGRFAFMRVLVAYSLDMAVLFILKNACELSLPLELIKSDALFLGALGGVYVLFFLLDICYFAVCEKYWGKTLGKKIAGLIVVQEGK